MFKLYSDVWNLYHEIWKKLTTQFHNGNWIFRNVRDFNLDKEKKRMIKNKNHELIMGFIMLESKWGCQANLKYYLIMAKELFWYVHYSSHWIGIFLTPYFLHVIISSSQVINIMASFSSLCLLDQNHITKGECSGLNVYHFLQNSMWGSSQKRSVNVKRLVGSSMQ